MLRRKSSKKHRRPLSRSKSTSSISTTRSQIRSLDSIDPDVAERDALTAALLSYNRAHGSPNVDMSRDSESTALGRSDSTSRNSKQSPRRIESVKDRQECSATAPNLQRQKSIRFAGPSAHPRRKMASRASDNREMLNSDGPNSRPASTLSYDPGASQVNPLTRCYLDNIQNTDPKENVDSWRISHHKLRKTRSMVSQTTAPCAEYYFNNSTPDQGRAHTASSRYAVLNKENEPSQKSFVKDPGLRAPKSMSFLRSRRERTLSRTGSRAENDLAVQLARDKFREQVEQQIRIKPQPSMFFRSKNRRSENSVGLRKSLRDSSINSTGISSTFSGEAVPITRQGTLRKTARKVSNSLRNKLKGLFARSKTESSDNPDNDQDEMHVSDAETGSHMEDPPSPEEASMCQVRSLVPSIHAIPSSQHVKSRQVSLESVASGDGQNADDKSRVTSWTDSVTNTIASQGTDGEWERQRLSIIKENGMHVPRLHVPQEANPCEVLASGPIVDSERVFSALMKRLAEVKLQEEEQRKKSIVDMKGRGVAPLRSTSVDQCGSHGTTTPTIRHVRPEDDVFQDQRSEVPFDGTSADCKIFGQPRSTSIGPLEHAACATSSYNDKSNSSLRKQADDDACSMLGHSKTISQRPSAFFGSPNCHLFRTASPYRRALQDTMNASDGANSLNQWQEAQLSNSLSAFSLPVRRPSTAGSEDNPGTTDAGSVYSSTTNDEGKISHRECPNPTVEEFIESSNTHNGDVKGFVDQPTHHPVASHRRESSTTSSVEWKTWLSAKVSKFETPTVPCTTSSYGLPALGHVREMAEIEPSCEPMTPERLKPGVNDRGPLNPVGGNTNLYQRHVQHDCPNIDATQRNENNYPIFGGESCSPSNKIRAIPSLPSMMPSCESTSPLEPSKIPRMRSFNTTNMSPLNPSRQRTVLKRRSRPQLVCGADSSAQSSPGLTTAVWRQFGASSTESPGHKVDWNRNHSLSRIRLKKKPVEDDIAGTGVSGPEPGAQAMGSKRMVVMFLNSRRKRMQSTGSDDGSSSSPAAFI